METIMRHTGFAGPWTASAPTRSFWRGELGETSWVYHLLELRLKFWAGSFHGLEHVG